MRTKLSADSVSYYEAANKFIGRDRVHIMMHNAKQIFEIVAAASGDTLSIESHDGVNCSELSSAADKLACEWHLLAEPSRLQNAQDSDDWERRVLQVGL